jgi:hypothetical protein
LTAVNAGQISLARSCVLAESFSDPSSPFHLVRWDQPIAEGGFVESDVASRPVPPHSDLDAVHVYSFDSRDGEKYDTASTPPPFLVGWDRLDVTVRLEADGYWYVTDYVLDLQG